MSDSAVTLPIGAAVRWTRGLLRGTVIGYRRNIASTIPEMVELIEFLGDDGNVYHDWPSNLERVDG
jgi:hypothetical protein